MKAARLPISVCHANCPQCGLPAEFKMFESGVGGDFCTFVGVATGAIYRLDLGKIHCQNIPDSTLLLEAETKEGRLKRVPEELRCKICGTVFSGRAAMIDGEEFVDAYDL